MGDIDFNAQGDINIGGHVVGRDMITNINYEAAAPPALNLHQLPPPPRDFTGREAELDELMAAVETGGVIIWGPPGVGKTALALKLAEALTSHFLDAQLHLDLRGTTLDPLPAADAMKYVIHAFYPAITIPQSEIELRGQYQSVLHGKRVLLLLDNAADDAQIEPLMPSATCYLLTTSRQRFTLPGIFVKTLTTLPPHDAHELLLAITPRIGKQVGAIADLCGYLPFALRLAGKTLAERIDLSPAEYVHSLENAQSRARLDLIAPSLQISYRLLGPELQKLWCMLAVFPDTFDRKAATAVWAFEPSQAQDILSTLLRLSLVEYIPPSTRDHPTKEDAGAPVGRYRLHDLSRLFASAHLLESERYEAQKRHAVHFVNVLWKLDELYQQGGNSTRNALELFDREGANIQAGQAWATTNMEVDNTATQLCNEYPDAGMYLLNLRQTPRERIQWLKSALTVARRLKLDGKEMAHLNSLGIAFKNLGEARPAIAYYEQSLAVARRINDPNGEGNALGNLGNAYDGLGEHRLAIEYHEQNLAIARKMNDRRGERNALGNLGNAYQSLGEYRRAIEYHEQSLTIAREQRDIISEATTLGNLGITYDLLAESHKAIEYHQKHLSLAREIKDRDSEVRALVNLGIACNTANDPHKAIELFHKALHLSQEIENIDYKAHSLWELSLAVIKLGDRIQAIAHAEAALKIFEQIEDPHAETVRKKLAEWRQRIDIG